MMIIIQKRLEITVVKTLEGNLTPTENSGRGFIFFACCKSKEKVSQKCSVQFLFKWGHTKVSDRDHFDQIDLLGMDTLQSRGF